MNRAARKPLSVGLPTPTANHKVRFGKESGPRKQHAEESPGGCVPRVARLLALAHRIDGMIRSGELKDWAEAARLIGITRPRMTQAANLMLLAPEIQETVLSLRTIGWDSIADRDLRPIAAIVDWRGQRRGISLP